MIYVGERSLRHIHDYDYLFICCRPSVYGAPCFHKMFFCWLSSASNLRVPSVVVRAENYWALRLLPVAVNMVAGRADMLTVRPL